MCWLPYSRKVKLISLPSLESALQKRIILAVVLVAFYLISFFQAPLETRLVITAPKHLALKIAIMTNGVKTVHCRKRAAGGTKLATSPI